MAQHQNSVLTQNAYVVRDIHDAMNRWIDNFGVGPFFYFPQIEIVDAVYRGAPSELEISIGLAYSGDVQIELIEQHTEGPSAYRDVVPKGQEGFHHICTYPDDYHAEIKRFEALGYEVAGSGKIGAPRIPFCYLDTRERLNCMIELVEMPEGMGDLWVSLKDTTANWDGKTDPIREMEL